MLTATTAPLAERVQRVREQAELDGDDRHARKIAEMLTRAEAKVALGTPLPAAG